MFEFSRIWVKVGHHLFSAKYKAPIFNKCHLQTIRRQHYAFNCWAMNILYTSILWILMQSCIKGNSHKIRSMWSVYRVIGSGFVQEIWRDVFCYYRSAWPNANIAAVSKNTWSKSLSILTHQFDVVHNYMGKRTPTSYQ